MKNPRIWLVNPFSDLPGEGATEGRYHTMARILVEGGYEVTWWTSDFHHRTKSYRKDVSSGLPFEIVQLPCRPYSRNISLRRLWSHASYGRAFDEAGSKRIVAGNSPDIINLSIPPLDCITPAYAMRDRCECKITFDVMDLWPETFFSVLPGSEKFRKLVGKFLFGKYCKLAKRAYVEADSVAAVSKTYLQHVRRIAPEQQTHLCYVGGWVDRSPSLVIPTLSNQKLHCIYVGSMTRSYDLKTIISAAKILKEDGLPFHIKFVGSGPEEQSLKYDVIRLELAEHVEFLGFLSEGQLHAHLAQADVGLNAVLNSTHITMPHKLSDYLCAGLAVANSLIGEAQDLLSKHDAGLTYLEQNAISLSEILRRWSVSSEFLLRQKQNARNLAKSQFSREITYRSLLSWVTQ